MTASTCPQCGAAFECCPQPDQRCWCLDLPLLPAEMLGKDAAACYCPACLRARLSSVSLGERDGAGASHATAAGPHLSPPPQEGGVTTVGKLS